MSTRALIPIILGAVSCSGGSGPVPEPDGGTDGGSDARPDGEAGPDADEPEDADASDAGASTCAAESEPEELTLEPAAVLSPRLASGPEGYGLVWLHGTEEPYDVMGLALDADLEPMGSPVTLALARPMAGAPEVIWYHGDWLAVWGDGQEDDGCTEAACRLSLHAARFSAEGELVTPPRPLWSDREIVGRPVAVETDGGAVIAGVFAIGDASRLGAGRLDRDTSPQASVAVLLPGRSARGTPPAAALAGDRVVVVGAVVSGGLFAVAVDAADLTLAVDPTEVVLDASASSPVAAAGGPGLGIAFLTGSERAVQVELVELDESLGNVGGPVEVSPGARWPREPALAPAPEGWVVAWQDGRNDPAGDCVTMRFCRNDIFVQAASVLGPEGSALEVSDDPNDCVGVSLTSRAGAVVAAWQTFREGRRTAFARRLQCD